MPDNDNGQLSDAEQCLISFIQAVRPESGPLLKLRTVTEEWIRQGKLCAMICFVAAAAAAVFDVWHGWPAFCAVCGAAAPALSIHALESRLGRWKGSLSFEQLRPVSHWHFERSSA